MKHLSILFAFCFTFSIAESKMIMGWKYRKLFYLPQADCRQACYLKTEMEGLTIVVMGKRDGDDFEVNVCEGSRLVMYQRFSMAGIKLDEQAGTWFKGTINLNKFLNFYFGISWKHRKPYIESGFIPTESTARCSAFFIAKMSNPCYDAAMIHDFYIYGRNAVLEQLKNNPKSLKRILLRDSVKQSGFEEIRELARNNSISVNATDDKEILRLLKDEVNHQGVIALSKPFEYANFDTWLHGLDMEKMPTVLILDHIQDVSNMGAIVRTATAAGVAGIIVAELNQAPVTSAVYKTSAGTVGIIPIIQVGNINQTIEKLKAQKFWVVGLGMDEGNLPAGKQGKTMTVWKYEFTEPTAIVIGNEGDGLREKTAEHCDTILSIPMQNGVESLNASVSAAVVCYEILRQRVR